jgi:hypothetical protein
MSDPLEGCRLRLARSWQHFNVIHSEFSSRPDQSKAVSFTQRFDPEANRIDAFVGRVPEFPTTWSLEFSEALFNLRAALDYLAWELAKWNLSRMGQSREPKAVTQYPIATSAAKLAHHRMVDLHPDHRAVIERFQPYGPAYMDQFAAIIAKGANAEGLAHGHPLHYLASLNNEDKHRFLKPTALTASLINVGPYEGQDCSITQTNVFVMVEINEGERWATFDVVPSGPNPHVEMRDWIIPGLSFGGRNVFQAFPEVTQFVDALLNKFAPTF